jgi:hypothetical protein
MLRKITILLNILVVLVSSFLFGYTFFAKQHVTEHARSFVTEKTLDYSRPAIEAIEQVLDSPIASKLISAEKKQAIESEIAIYRSSPSEYVVSLTSVGDRRPSQFESDRVGQLKQKIRDYYETTLRDLIVDLRIFTGSNIAAGLFGLILLCSSRIGSLREVQVFSLVIFASVVISSYAYIDGLSFFRILFKWHMGWSYPVGIIITSFYIYYQYLETKKQNKPAHPTAGNVLL